MRIYYHKIKLSVLKLFLKYSPNVHKFWKQLNKMELLNKINKNYFTPQHTVTSHKLGKRHETLDKKYFPVHNFFTLGDSFLRI